MKYLLDFRLQMIERTSAGDAMLTLTPLDFSKGLAAMKQSRPGQFVNIQVLRSHDTFLRRPISICDINIDAASLFLYVKDAGPATHALCQATPGELFSILMPLGNGFDTELPEGARPLLVAGGVGIAPMLMLSRRLSQQGIRPAILIGAQSAPRLILADELSQYGELHISTDDGSRGERGLVVDNSVFADDFDRIYCCGPLPMMKAVAAAARGKGIPCMVSLENKMACGLGACLCCVEDTRRDGNVCVCTQGPVFDTNLLNWQ